MLGVQGLELKLKWGGFENENLPVVEVGWRAPSPSLQAKHCPWRYRL